MVAILLRSAAILLLVGTCVHGLNENCRPKAGKDITNGCVFTPNLEIVVTAKNVKINSTNCNSIVKKQDFVYAPKVFYPNADEKKTYTLLMLDPDAPGHGNGKFFLHWVVTNLKGERLKNGKISKGNILTTYRKPGPPKDTGDHRYIFIIYEQPEGTGQKFTDESANRRMFDLDAWLKKQPTLCGPIAGSQFKAHH